MKDVYITIDGTEYRVVVAKMGGVVRNIGYYAQRKVHRGVIENAAMEWCSIPERCGKLRGKLDQAVKDVRK